MMAKHIQSSIILTCLLAYSSADVIEITAPAEGVESVTVLPNGTVVEAAYEAVDLNEAAAKALPEGELKSLLNWAISHSNPQALQEQAAGKATQDELERRQKVHEAIEAMRNEPSEAQLMIEAIEVLDNDTLPDAAKLAALEALQYLLEPIDNANDLHKLGGVEVLIVALEPKQTDAVRAGAAHALGVAASNNEEVQLRLWDAGGEGIVVQLLEIAEMDDQDAAAKGLYALSNLQGSEGFREATVSKGGLGVLQRLLSAGSGAASRVKRRALTLVGDLARRARDFARAMHLLPARGQGLASGLERQLNGSDGDWDMAERALHAIQSIVALPKGPELLQGTGLLRRLQALKQALREEMASAESVSREYLKELLALVEQTQAQLHARLGTQQQQQQQQKQPDQAQEHQEPDVATKAEL